MGEFLTYKKFATPWEAEPVIEVLKKNFIPYEFVQSARVNDAVIIGSELYGYEIQIEEEQFETVNTLLQQEAEADLEETDDDHYLFSFTDEELTGILAKPDEWGEHDYLLARKILSDRGIKYTDQELAQIKATRIQELAKPEISSASSGLIIAGYVFCVFGSFMSMVPRSGYITAVAGPFLGLIIGLTIINSMKTLPDGKRVHAYSQKSRKNARVLTFIALIFVAFAVAVRIGGYFI